MFSPRQNYRVNGNKVIREPKNGHEHSPLNDNLQAENKDLRSQLNSLASKHTDLRESHYQQYRQIIELKKQLETSDKDRSTIKENSRNLRARLASKEKRFNDLSDQYYKLEDEHHSLRRSLRQVDRQPRRHH